MSAVLAWLQDKFSENCPPDVFRTRLITAVIAIPLVIILIKAGGLGFFALVLAVLTAAVVEFCQLVGRIHFRPALPFALGLLWVLLLDAQFPHRAILGPGMSLVLLGSLAWQMAHRQGNPVADWALTIVGALYLGWCGAHVVRLRNMPEGLWWTMTVLPAIWLADSSAYLVGRAWGRHKLAPALSPGKTWEGYIGGVVVGTLLTTGLAALWSLVSGPMGPRAIDGLGIGLVVSILAPIGDLAISMIKRQVGAKDSGVFFPGHGGALDRIDSLLWAAILGYYYILWLR